jgi:hypothetical protein
VNKKLTKFCAVFLLFCFLSTSVLVFAQAQTTGQTAEVVLDEAPVEPIVEVSIESKMATKIGMEEATFNTMIENIKTSVTEDINKTMDNFLRLETEIIPDVLVLETWGDFLYDYYGKTLMQMPFDPVTLPTGVTLGTKEEKEVITEFINPLISTTIQNAVKDKGIGLFAPKLDIAMPLQDYSTKTDFVLTGIVEPISEDIKVLSVGAETGVGLNPVYLAILNSIKTNNGVYSVLPDQNIGVTEEVQEVVEPAQGVESTDGAESTDGVVEESTDANITFTEPQVKNYIMSVTENLLPVALPKTVAVEEITELSYLSYVINPTTMEFFEKQGINYTKIDAKAPVKILGVYDFNGSRVIIPLKYSEFVTLGGTPIFLGSDISILNKLTGVGAITTTTNEQVTFSEFEVDGALDIQLGDNRPFNIFYPIKAIPLTRVATFIANDTEVYTDEQKKQLVSLLDGEMDLQGRADEWKEIKKANGLNSGFELTGILKWIVLLAVGLSLAVLVHKLKERTFPKKEKVNANVPFQQAKSKGLKRKVPVPKVEEIDEDSEEYEDDDYDEDLDVESDDSDSEDFDDEDYEDEEDDEDYEDFEDDDEDEDDVIEPPFKK